ncbi:dUTP diphosphatase [Candidatus Sumerlaeota bacterium]|nr:dUTP diphosphatase [Candidatus Sumerlaeota bacterium]
MPVTIQIRRLAPKARLPEQQHPGDAGWDLRALEAVTIPPGERCLVRTGLAVAIPAGWEGQVRPRSGLALRRGLTVLNSPGTVDSGYRGEVCVILLNTDRESQTLEAGERVAQMVIAPVASEVVIVDAESLPESQRGEGGFGHTGHR